MPRSELHCWWDGVRIAAIEARKPWDLRLRYTDEALDRWPTNTMAVSCSLPIQRRSISATPFLRGLLPEGRHLQVLADRAGVATNDTFSLLHRYGRDIAGALVITDGEEAPDPARWSIDPYSEESLAVEVHRLEDGALGVRPDSELSIAGLQNKLLLVDMGSGRWGRPVHGRPSTHILKVEDDRYPGLVTLEADVLRLAASVGLSRLDPIVASVGDAKCLIVRRYDRSDALGVVGRLHQEDACQALGIDPQGEHGQAKYEMHGGPSWARIARLLRDHARDGSGQLEKLIQVATFTCLVGNADGHGKNVSLLHDADGFIALAPLYDTVPTMVWPKLRATAAMSVNGRWSFDETSIDDLVNEAQRWGLDRSRALEAVIRLSGQVRDTASSAMSQGTLADRVVARSEALLSSAPRSAS